MESFALLERGTEVPETVAAEKVEKSSPVVQDGRQHLTPAVFSSDSSVPATTTSNIRLKPPPTPTSFWDTPVGRRLDDSSEVRWASGDGRGGGADVVSRKKGALSGPTEQGAGNSSSSTPVVNAGAGPGAAGASAGIDGLQMARAAEEEAQLNRRGSSLPTPPLPSPSQKGGPVLPDILGEVALVEDAHQDTAQESTAARVGVEQVTAQGTGAKAVRSLSRVGGGGGGEGSMEIGAPTPETVFESWPRPNGIFLLEGGPPRVSAAFQVSPTSVSLGAMQVGRAVPVKVQVANVGDKPARFRVDSRLSKHGRNEKAVVGDG